MGRNEAKFHALKGHSPAIRAPQRLSRGCREAGLGWAPGGSWKLPGWRASRLANKQTLSVQLFANSERPDPAIWTPRASMSSNLDSQSVQIQQSELPERPDPAIWTPRASRSILGAPGAWRLLDALGVFRRVLEASGGSWRLPGGFWRLLEASEDFWRLLEAPGGTIGGSWRLLEAPRLEASGGFWRLLEASGDFWRFLEASGGAIGGSWRLLELQKASGGFWRLLEGLLEAPGGSWRLLEAPGSSQAGGPPDLFTKHLKGISPADRLLEASGGLWRLLGWQ